MLIQIAQVVGGNVRITKNKENVVWVVDNAIIEIIKIFEQYPPLTSRKICQLKFLIECLKHNNVDRYLAERDQKYDNQSLILNAPFVVPLYFQAWLAGFVEAEGCFTAKLGPNSHPSFSLGQNNDLYLLEAIKSELKITTKILLRTKGVFFILTAYRRETLLNIIKYFENYPLLGAKAVSLKELKKKLEE